MKDRNNILMFIFCFCFSYNRFYIIVKGSSAVADPVPLRMKLEGPPTVVGNDCSLY